MLNLLNFKQIAAMKTITSAYPLKGRLILCTGNTGKVRLQFLQKANFDTPMIRGKVNI